MLNIIAAGAFGKAWRDVSTIASANVSIADA